MLVVVTDVSTPLAVVIFRVLVYIYVEKFRNLFKIFKNYEGSKCQAIVNKHKILSVLFSEKITIKNNDFATQNGRFKAWSLF